MVVKFVMMSCYQDISRNVQISEKDFSRLSELAIAILQVEQPLSTSITALTLRLLGAALAEFTSYFDLKKNLQQRPSQLANQCYQQIQPLHNPDTVYAHLEQLLTDICRPFALEQNNTQLAYGLKISLNSILPRSDVIVFRDMLIKESAQDKPDVAPSGERQLIELAEVTAGVSLVGDPPIQALQALEQQIVVLLKQIEIQFNQQLGVYVSTILPMCFYQFDQSQPQLQQQQARQLMLYQMNRVSIVQSFSTLFKQLSLLNTEFEQTSKTFKDQVQQLQQLLKSQESIPKATIYPKFAQISAQYSLLQAFSEQLVQLKQWHSRLSAYLEDREFTVLPDANAKAPLYDSEDVARARAKFQSVFGKSEKDSVQKSRFMRLALSSQQEQNSLLKDLSQFQALDAEDLLDCDCLFNGLDPSLCFCPSLARPGLLAFANAPFCVFDLQQLAQRIVVNNPALELPDNKAARERPTASAIVNKLTTLPSPRGYELVGFSNLQSKSLFEQSPGLFCAYPIALSLSSPDYLPLAMLMDLPKLARVLNSIQLKPLRAQLLNTCGPQHFDFQPARNQLDEQPLLGLGALVFKNVGAKRLQLDGVGYVQKPKAVQLFEGFLLGRLGENEVAGSVLSSAYSVEGLLSSEVLSYYGDFYGGAVPQKYLEYKKSVYKVNPETLIGQESLAQKQPQSQGVQNVAANTVDEEIQTPLHFYESNIVDGYTSSEWELRARALRLYEIQKKRTKAGNTDETISKAELEVQTVEKRDAEVQQQQSEGTHAVQHFAYQRRILPAQMYESQAKVVRDRCQTYMKLDLDQVKKDADKLQQLRAGK